jgi:hypothetical protein
MVLVKESNLTDEIRTTEAEGTTGKKGAMTLSECAAFDMKNHARENLTGWGKVCKDRAERGLSRRGNARRARKGTK